MADRLDLPSRQAKIARLKAQIAAGTYETPEKLEAAVDVLWAALDSQKLPPRPPKRPK